MVRDPAVGVRASVRECAEPTQTKSVVGVVDVCIVHSVWCIASDPGCDRTALVGIDVCMVHIVWCIASDSGCVIAQHSTALHCTGWDESYTGCDPHSGGAEAMGMLTNQHGAVAFRISRAGGRRRVGGCNTRGVIEQSRNQIVTEDIAAQYSTDPHGMAGLRVLQLDQLLASIHDQARRWRRSNDQGS